MSTKETIKAAVDRLDLEVKNYYKSANEAFYTSVGHAVLSFVLFSTSSILIPSKVIPLEDLKSLIGFGGAGASGSITLTWGLRQRLERRDKARQIEAQKVSLERLSELSDFNDENTQKKIAEKILELTLRTISSPYEPPREKAEGTK